MPEYESVPVPFIRHGDHRRCLTDKQIFENDHLRDFVERFPASFEYDPVMCVHVFVGPAK